MRDGYHLYFNNVGHTQGFMKRLDLVILLDLVPHGGTVRTIRESVSV
jgi:hypothetical protein